MPFGKRILVLIPHPDDEVIGCGGAIIKAQIKGCEIFGLYLTTGIPPKGCIWFWRRKNYEKIVQRRRQEAHKAAHILQLSPLGFLNIPSRRLKGFIDLAMERICRLLAEKQISTLWVPAYEGAHQDHDTANFLSSYFVSKVDVWEFSEYNYYDQKVSSNRFFNGGSEAASIPLSEEQRKVKVAAMASYRSEWLFIRSFKGDNEVFRTLHRYDYRNPPYKGKMYYQRFQKIASWHQRVDNTTPEELCRAFDRFRKVRNELF